MHKSIDIIIPSFRLQPLFILPILTLLKPEDADIKFYIIADNPAIILDEHIDKLVDNQKIHLEINPKNLGASITRNSGIEMSNSEWILFLDDDITVMPDLLINYSNAINEYPNEIGFIGLITLPEPESAFTKAVVASGSSEIFSIADRKVHYAWGATANIAVKRSSIGTVRFSTDFPKAGGGEDLDFFLKVRKANGYKDFRTLKTARVWHPWWNDQKPDFKRAFRYGKGTGLLKILNPEYTRLDFLSTPETFFLSLLLLISAQFFPFLHALIIPLAIFTIGIIGVEIIANLVASLKNPKLFSVSVVYYVVLLKLAYDTGILWTNFYRRSMKGIGQRFNDDGSLKGINFIRFNRYKITKVLLYLCLAIFLIFRFA